MTDTRISQLSAMLQGLQGITSAMETEAAKKTEAAFGALLSQTAEKGCENQYSWTEQIGKNSVVTENNQTVYEKEAAKNSFKDNGIVKERNEDVISKLPKDAKEQIEAVGKEVREILEEKLGVSEEELLQVMEQMGITLMDLADPAQLAQLVMELTGSQDGSELLLNPDFQTLMAEVNELFAQLQEGLNLTPEEFEQLTAQLAEMQENAPTGTDNQPLASEEAEPVLKANQQETEKVQNNVPLQEAEQTEASNGVKEEGQPEEMLKVTSQEETAGEQTGEEGQNNSEENPKSSAQELAAKTEITAKKEHPQAQVSFQTTTQTVNNGQTLEVVQTVTQTQIDVESILRQVSQMTRISVTQAMSSIEMQLNPENLGKVYLQVISKEGAITAQLAAQNEAVKEVLESQIAALKESMNQQGMKVEAIEVTVASHEFEQNLEEKQENPAKEQQETENTSKRGRDLKPLEELDGLMSEEEALAAKIMQENGNSVNLTA